MVGWLSVDYDKDFATAGPILGEDCWLRFFDEVKDLGKGLSDSVMLFGVVI